MPKRVTTISAGLFMTLTAGTALAAPYTFQTIAVPGVDVRSVNGINDAGQIVGTTLRYESFFGTLATGVFVQYPRLGFATSGQAINNNGLITGSYAVSGSDVQYVRDTGTGTITTYPNFPGFMVTSSASGINDAGVIVGTYTGGYYAGRADRGFVFDTVSGALSTFADPSTGPNNGYYNVPPTTLGFTDANDINNTGQIVGTTLLPTQNGTVAPAGFILDQATGLFTHLNVPGSSATYAEGINDIGQIVGSYLSGTTSHAFLYERASGLYTTLTDPDGVATTALGINNAGQIVGQYIDAAGNSQSFVATPTDPASPVPEPASIALLALAAGVVAVSRRHT